MIMIFTGLVNPTLAFALTYILWEEMCPLQKEMVILHFQVAYIIMDFALWES